MAGRGGPGGRLGDEAAGAERIVARARTGVALAIVALSIALLPTTDGAAAIAAQLAASIAALMYALVVEFLLRRRHTDVGALGYATTTIDVTAIVLGTLAVALSADRPDFATKSPSAFLYFLIIAAAGLRQSPRLVWYATGISASGFALLLIPALVYTPELVSLRGLGLDDLSSERVGVARVALVVAFIVVSGGVIGYMTHRTRAIAIENVRLFGEIQEGARRLEAASRHKSEFLANMSHELRTPLNAIIGFSDVLEQRMFGELNQRQGEYVRDIATSGRHLLDLVNEILDLSKIEAGRMELEPSEFDLTETIRAALLFVRDRAARHGIQLAADVPDDLGTVVGDERKVRQVLLNLLSNAVKFTPDGGWIGVSARRADDAVEVSIRDTGIGIAPADQPAVFDEFRQVGKPSERSREGTGLGLTLAKRFVELHGGRIWLDSELGKGTTFTFAIPVGRVAAAPA
jgi:signal transduction histidine kinase